MSHGPPAAAAPWLDPAAVPFVRIEALTKRFGDFTAVDAVDLAIYKGELFSILGALRSLEATIFSRERSSTRACSKANCVSFSRGPS